MNKQSTRQKDYKIEHEVSHWLDEHFYPKMGWRFQRNEDLQLQYRGCDVILNDKVIIDEKAKIYNCLNTTLQYLSFELNSLSKTGIPQYGWLVRPDSITQVYSFISVYTSAQREEDIRFSNISKLVVLWVFKEDVMKCIHSCWDSRSNAELMKCARYIRDGYEDRLSLGKYFIKISKQLVEQPINAVFKRSTLKSFTHSREFEITESEIKRI